MKIITLGIILFFSSIISAQIEKIDIPKNKLTKKYLTKVLVDYLNRNENHNVKIPFWVKPIHNNNFNKLNKNKIYSTNKDWNHLPIKNVKGVYEFCGVLINHSDFNHIMFVYDNYVKIIAEAEEKALIDELEIYKTTYSLNDSTYNKILNFLESMFESRLYRDAFGSDFISDSTGHKYIEFKNLSDERLGILKNSNNEDTSYTSFYVAGKIKFSSEEICLTDYDMNNLKNEHFSITMIVVPYIDAFKYMKIKNPTYQDWKKHIIPLKKYIITKEKLESSNWTLTYP